MKTVYKILSYDEPIHTLRRWTQQFLAYSFTCVHRPNLMMQDVDALSRYLNPLVAQQAKFVAFFRRKDINDRADAYSSSVFDELLRSNKYAIKKHSSSVSQDIATNNISPAKRKQKKLCSFTNTQSLHSNKHRKFVKTKPSPCFNTVVNSSIVLNSNTLRKFIKNELSPCLNTVVNSPVVSLFELQLSEKWENLTRPVPHSINVAPSCMPIALIKNMRQIVRQRIVAPKFFSTLQFSFDETAKKNNQQ